jgi:hypothetical protein
MTGQVKEEILTRMGELGVHIDQGQVRFDPALLKSSEFFREAHTFEYIDLTGAVRQWQLGADSLAFTLFQVPVCYQLADESKIILEFNDGETIQQTGNFLTTNDCVDLYKRNGRIRSITVILPENPTHS